MRFKQATTDDPDMTDESNDESRMSNDELMTKRDMARGEQGAAVSSPPSLGLRRCGISDSTTDDAEFWGARLISV